MAVLKYYDTGTSSWQYIAASTTANFTTWKKTVAGGETSVSGTDDNAVTLSYTVGLEQVFINGVLQVRGSDYTATTGTSITGLSALAANDVVTVICYAPFNVANTIAPTLVDAKGDLIAGTAADTVGRLAVSSSDVAFLRADSTASTGLKWDNDAWTTWSSPTTSGITIGNGTVTARYKQIGKVVFAYYRFVLGSTSSITGDVYVTLPINISGGGAYHAQAYAVVGTVYPLMPEISGQNLYLRAMGAGGTYVTGSTTLSSTIPASWTTNHSIQFGITYEAA